MAQDPFGYSFIIPAYNDAAGLQRHFAYFAACGARVQLVIVDDCSQDGTEAAVAAAELPENIRITYRRMAENGGPAAARNLGITLAGEERVMFLDADDLLAPCFFDVMRLAPLGGETDFVLFKYHLSRDAGQRFSYDMHPVDRRFFSRRPEASFPLQRFRLQDRPEAMATVNFPWNKLYSRGFLQRADIRFPDLRMHEDITPHWQSFLRCRQFGVLDWAPPLITHWEVPQGGRATQYVGEKRMDVFAELANVEAELLTHAGAGRLLPVFAGFCEDLFTWMRGRLCDGGGAGAERWRRKYAAAAAAFWAASEAEQPQQEDEAA
ncbi:glycosyltransferase family 2 protein (plasmid) [Leisingera sp. S132]|uniref:glycosyltransferase family 2 protein n=1 Tax=Leisingera sp. S132 TaxID=2867016 RepID=UPI0021A5825C|nr:glycosyltransferase family A protein [Leisingera sp. S132]UWQ81926.1 glycosyltransferase family 2 protein [Leisingera sp. S132]